MKVWVAKEGIEHTDCNELVLALFRIFFSHLFGHVDQEVGQLNFWLGVEATLLTEYGQREVFAKHLHEKLVVKELLLCGLNATFL